METVSIQTMLSAFGVSYTDILMDQAKEAAMMKMLGTAPIKMEEGQMYEALQGLAGTDIVGGEKFIVDEITDIDGKTEQVIKYIEAGTDRIVVKTRTTTGRRDDIVYLKHGNRISATSREYLENFNQDKIRLLAS